MPVAANSENLTGMSKLLHMQALEKVVCVTVTVMKFLEGKILLSNELKVKNILGYKLLLIS